jgi:tetratricopeptide (TPR) repeat protein
VQIEDLNLDPDDTSRWLGLSNLGEALQALGRNGEALVLYQRALALLERQNNPNSPLLADPLAGLGRAHLAAKDPAPERDGGSQETPRPVR